MIEETPTTHPEDSNSRFDSRYRRGLTSWPSTEKRSRGRKLITLGSGAAIPIHPPAVITGNESTPTTLHFADSVARTAEFAGAIIAIALWNSGDGDSESEDGSEESLHSEVVDFG